MPATDATLFKAPNAIEAPPTVPLIETLEEPMTEDAFDRLAAANAELWS